MLFREDHHFASARIVVRKHRAALGNIRRPTCVGRAVKSCAYQPGEGPLEVDIQRRLSALGPAGCVLCERARLSENKLAIATRRSLKGGSG